MEDTIRRWTSRLEQTYDRLQRCSVVVEQPHHHHRRGNVFRVHVELDVRGHEIVSRNAEHADAHVAVADAFRAARRWLDAA